MRRWRTTGTRDPVDARHDSSTVENSPAALPRLCCRVCAFAPLGPPRVRNPVARRTSFWIPIIVPSSSAPEVPELPTHHFRERRPFRRLIEHLRPRAITRHARSSVSSTKRASLALLRLIVRGRSRIQLDLGKRSQSEWICEVARTRWRCVRQIVVSRVEPGHRYRCADRLAPRSCDSLSRGSSDRLTCLTR